MRDITPRAKTLKYKPLRIHLEVFETVFSSFVLSLQCGKKETKKKGEDDKLFSKNPYQ